MIQTIETAIRDVKIIVPPVFDDTRGFFLESFQCAKMAAIIGSQYTFLQDNHSFSVKNVLRGLHYQVQHPQGKLVRVITGEIYDVAVDLRQGSPTFGHWTAAHLSAENHFMMWIPPQFAHGFMVVSESAHVIYKATDYYDPSHEKCLLWDDPDLDIAWPERAKTILSAKDQQGALLKDAELF